MRFLFYGDLLFCLGFICSFIYISKIVIGGISWSFFGFFIGLGFLEEVGGKLREIVGLDFGLDILRMREGI